MRTGEQHPPQSTTASPLLKAEKHDIQVAIHTDTLNESGFVEDTLAAFKDRTIHTFYTEGAGGGHAPQKENGHSFGIRLINMVLNLVSN